MKQHPRNLMVVMVVATAMFADRAIAAAPVSKPLVAQAAGRLVDRLAVRFCRTVEKPARFYQPTKVGTNRVERDVPVPVATGEPVHRPTSPFQFRLPPPMVA